MKESEAERSRAAEESLAPERSHEFLLLLGDALRPLTDALEAESTAMRMLTEHLGVSHAYYYQGLPDEDVVQVGRGYSPGDAAWSGRVLRISDFGDELLEDYRSGKTLVFDDAPTAPPAMAANFLAVGICACVGVPLVKDGRLVAVLGVHQPGPRQWTAAEVRLIEEVAERTWEAVERARAEAALRQSEERHAFLLRLTDALRPLSRAADIQTAAVRLLGEQLQTGWACYGETNEPPTHITVQVEHTRGVASLKGAHPLSSFELLRELQQGWSAWESDLRSSTRASEGTRARLGALGVRSLLAAPILKNEGRLLALVVVADDEVRHWSDFEIALVENVADRTWAAVERARAEQALRLAADRLREADRRKSEFLAMLGHELRSPLAALEGGVKLLQSPRTRAESQEAVLPIVAKQVAHMKRVIDDVLDLAQLEGGHLQLALTVVDLEEVLRSALEVADVPARAKGSSLRFQPPPRPCHLRANPDRLVQVFSNLLANALKFSPPGSAVELWVECDDVVAVIYVRDHGRGISPEDLREIFEPFVQSKLSLGLPGGGLGLGLSVSRELVALHGGTLEARSEGLSRGSTFVVSLPIEGPAEPPSEESRQS